MRAYSTENGKTDWVFTIGFDNQCDFEMSPFEPEDDEPLFMVVENKPEFIDADDINVMASLVIPCRWGRLIFQFPIYEREAVSNWLQDIDLAIG